MRLILGWTGEKMLRTMRAQLLCFLLAGCSHTATETPSPPIDSRATSPSGEPESTTEAITIVAWNVESDGNDPAVIATQLAELDDYDIYCLSEVRSENFDRYENASGDDFASIRSQTGRSDRLQIIFHSDRFELLQQDEMSNYGEYELNNGSHRSPLFVRLRDRETDAEFIVMTNHLARGDAELRTRQATGLREWARDQNVPIVNIGDFNMDFDFTTERGNDAFTEMIRDNVWQWIRPAELIDTNWSDRDGDGMDDFPDSLLDFAFVAGPAKEWNPVSRVIVRDGDFPDDETTSDHRPIELILTP